MGAEPEPGVPVRPAAAVVLVPFPAQGHVSPILLMARALAARGVDATVAVPDFVHRRIVVSASQDGTDGHGVELASIPSGVPDDGDGDPPGFAGFAHSMEHDMPARLEEMLTRRALTGRGVVCLIVDVLASWAVPVAERCGVPAMGFWPAMLATYRAVAAIPELIGKGLISNCGIPISTKQLPINGAEVNGHHLIGDSLNILPAELELSASELPWLVGDEACQRSRFTVWRKIMTRAKILHPILVNSFPGEDLRELQQPQDRRILQVGPLPTNGIFDHTTEDSSLQESPRLRNPSMWKSDETCMDWLDRQKAGSVIYVSFGSWVASIGRDAIYELALGLEATGLPFLWTLKDEQSWRGGLPDRYTEAVSGRGKIVPWSPQEDVLKHKAVGCYLTHCGWNSTMEAIQHGVRLLCYPVSGDQFINCAYIVKMWGIGIRLSSTKGSVVQDCVKRIMEGEDGGRLQEKVDELRERVMMGRGRRTAKMNLEYFVDRILRRDDHALGKLS
ncbi:hypothetical protein QOZ80_2BG0194090 [Eleusine coracana subsp. coracana]|nr:hypothetical protein QOZ80_2BG0194090 [Eleusine coracana subsp. coracana]